MIDFPDDSLPIFEQINQCVVSRRPMFLDAKNVKHITIDTLLYLLALLNRAKWLGLKFDVKGNLPLDSASKTMFTESGFDKYVRLVNENLSDHGDFVKISSGHNADPIFAKNICQFTMEKFKVGRVSTTELYDVILEIILNTVQHAYDTDRNHSKWYSYARYDKVNHKIHYAILDTGVGIPETVNKNFTETVRRLLELFGLQSSDVFLIKSALNGEFRSETKLDYRGKGLPTIKAYSDNNYINDLTIISSRGYLRGKEERHLSIAFLGTLYAWTITESSFKEKNK